MDLLSEKICLSEKIQLSERCFNLLISIAACSQPGKIEDVDAWKEVAELTQISLQPFTIEHIIQAYLREGEHQKAHQEWSKYQAIWKELSLETNLVAFPFEKIQSEAVKKSQAKPWMLKCNQLLGKNYLY